MKLSLIILFLPIIAIANTDISKTILDEYQTLRSHITSLEPDFTVDGHMMGKNYKNFELLWMLDDDLRYHEVLRFFRERDNGDVFAITYHRSQNIVRGRTVVRRFIGTEPTGWINHTIDMKTGEYLGQQGSLPYLEKVERKIIKDWNITLF